MTLSATPASKARLKHFVFFMSVDPLMFVNNATGQKGLVCQYDVVCFDEVSGISFDKKETHATVIKFLDELVDAEYCTKIEK